jgi:imidazolonepropionase
VEIKSGYGLDLDSELKMLRVARKLASISDLTVKTTFLGAHAVPPEFKGNADGYVDLLCETMVPKVVDEGLADYIDVFCDRGFFTPEQTDRILEAGAKHGLKSKIHANELDYSGGIQAGVRNNAISVDHLEYTGTKEIACLLDSETMPTLLPSTAFFLNLPYAPARNMIDAGLPVTLATDYNPGSTPSGRMAFVLSLACIKMNMTPEEALNAATVNGAKAMEVHADHGRIAPGAMANVIITKAIPSLAYIPYSFGSDLVESVIIKGRLR